MTGKIINLRQARKNKKRKDKELKAEQNRVTFGRTRQEKETAKDAIDRLNRDLDQKKLEDD